MLRFADTHAHLHFGRFNKDRDEVVERFKKAGGEFLLNIGVNLEDSKAAVEIAQRYGFKAAVGIHPHDSKDVPTDFLQHLQDLASLPVVTAIGECGLDYYRDLSPREVQREVFQAQVDLATALNLPLVIHVREAYEDVYDILKSSQLPDPPGVIHAFSADCEWALKFIKLGFLIGIGGPVTYPKNEKLREALRCAGVENIVTETDSPYLPPQSRRGRRNEPVYVLEVVETIARVLDMKAEEVGEITLNNALEVFER